MRVIPVASVNRHAKKPESFVALSEEEYLCGVLDAALCINTCREKPIVLISGPSGSGKTSTAHRLRAELTALGRTTHIISMDNYFLPIKGDISKVDLESPDRLDKELFREQTEKICRSQEVILPVFDFKNQERNEGEKFKRGKDDFVIIEGIHALNPDVMGEISDSASKVYVSVRTRLKSGASKLHPSKIRLIRRLVRDRLFRGRPLWQTIEFFDKVERGEKLYIMPFKKYADFDIDTFIPYEPCVYKKHVINELKILEQTEQISEMVYFLELLENIDDEFVPSHSLVREFIGGHSLME